MLSIREITARLQMMQVLTRIEERDTAHAIANNEWVPRTDTIMPKAVGKAREKAWLRLIAQNSTLGRKVVARKMASILGDVSWGGSDDELDDDLLGIDLTDLAKRLLKPLIVDGISAGMAHETVDLEGRGTGQFTITRLNGYLQPYTDPDDMDVITGLYQAWTTTVTSDMHVLREREARINERDEDGSTLIAGVRWNVRIYDWADGEENASIREWRNLGRAIDLGRPPDTVIERDAPVPRLAIWDTNDSGLPVGEITTSLPEFKRYWSSYARLFLSEELAGQPMPVIKGDADVDNFGPAEPVALSSEGGDFYWSEPGNLEELRKQVAVAAERIREDLSLPGGMIGGDTPSGEALREAGMMHENNSDQYASILEGQLSRLVADFAELTSANAASVGVTTNHKLVRPNMLENLLSLYKARVIPLGAIVPAAQMLAPWWSDVDAQTWVEEQTATVSLEDFDRFTGEGQNEEGVAG